MFIEQAGKAQLQEWESELTAEYQQFKQQGFNLDLTRGKPAARQLDLANMLDGMLDGDYKAADGTDTRNYGCLDGIPEVKNLGAELLGVTPARVLVGGNSSLTLMYQSIHFAWLFGTHDNAIPWKDEDQVKFLCPVPGYDRHFSICEELGIDMINISMAADGPDMDQVESQIRADNSIKGIWCVPKYSNPSGIVYSDDVIERLARLGEFAAPNFRIFLDNAYVVHDLVENPPQLANIMEFCDKYGTESSVLQFASTSKVSFAGAGISFLVASESNLAVFRKHLGIASIGPDKVNQLRHARLFPTVDALKAHMGKQAELLRPKFDTVFRYLEDNFTNNDLGSWDAPKGGYFVSFNTRPGVANEVVKLAAAAGVKLTPAGATFPYGKDPEDRNIRLSPSFPVLEEVDATMKVFVNCVKLASVRQQLRKQA